MNVNMNLFCNFRPFCNVCGHFSQTKIDRFVLVIAWFGGQLRINFQSKILKFLCNCPSL